MKFRRSFFAYPSRPDDLTAPIQKAAVITASSGLDLELKVWPTTDVFGAYIPDEIRDSIDSSDVLLCDVTFPNMNVYYEIGYAIGRGKTIAPVYNASFADAFRNIQKDGYFDNIGLQKYENANDLCRIISSLPTVCLAELYAKPINSSQPLFILDTSRKTDFRNTIVSAVKDAKAHFRTFDPTETPRFSTVQMISEITSSSGIILPFLADSIDGAFAHNLRAAFLAGLSHGLGRSAIIIQHNKPTPSDPADFRDMIVSVWNESDLNKTIVEFAQASLAAAQSIRTPFKRSQKNQLQKISLGASAAENEFKTLETYFVETAEFLRVMRGEVHILAGRKGSGKTAIFFRARDILRDEKNAFVVDLRPDSHQLSLFREELLKTVGSGIFDHTLAAFWYYVILSELLYTIRKQYAFKARFDSRAIDATSEIDSFIQQHGLIESGDFTTRINRLGNYIMQEIRRRTSAGRRLSAEELTNIVFRECITPIRALIEKFTDSRSKMYFLFDNIDKGWPATGLDPFDVRLVRLLIESLSKVQRDFSTCHRDFYSCIFLRNDVFELLVEETPDRGKNAQAVIDWKDRAELKQLICRRLQAALNDDTSNFDEIWGRFFVKMVGDRDAFEYCVDHCLMRPRFLIDIIDNAISCAINRGHQIVEADDLRNAVVQHSNYLIADFGYEIRDVSGLDADILYSMIGLTELLTKEETLERYRKSGIPESDLERAFRLMLWYGVLGIASTNDGKSRFIYDYHYNLKRMQAEINVLGSDILYAVNPALHVAMKL